MAQSAITKSAIMAQTREFGAEFTGFAPAARWEEFGDVPAAAYPQAIWPQVKTVIVIGVPLWLPLIEAAPSVLGREQLTVTAKLLEKAAYRLILLLNGRGCRAVSAPWNNAAATVESPAAFSSAWAGHYAGLGTVGWNHALLTREYGPRVAWKSVFTDLVLPGDPLPAESLCTRCLSCRQICPTGAFSGVAADGYAAFDQPACLQREQRLQTAFCNPCGACLKVCPVGEDRDLFHSNDFDKYFAEQAVLANDPEAAAYSDWVHIRSYGSYPIDSLPGRGK